MGKIVRLFFLIVVCALNAEQYQDIIINGHVVSQGVRESATRYEAIRQLLINYKRPFSVIDIGASQGYFSFRIAHEFPYAYVTMIEGDYKNSTGWTAELLELCKQNNSLDHIIYLQKHLKVSDLKRLSEVEHFDVVLALNVIHHFGNKWQAAADALFNLGDYIVVEIPPSTDKVFAHNAEIKKMEEYLVAKGGTVIAQTPRHTDKTALSQMRLYYIGKNQIPYKHWFYGSSAQETNSSYSIKSNFEEKKFIKTENGTTVTRDWYPGINFVTFKILNGVWPQTKTIVSGLIEFASSQHRDLLPWNIIVQGKEVKTIDDEGLFVANTVTSLLKTIQFATLETPQEVQDFILNHLYPMQWLQKEKLNVPTRATTIKAEVSFGELIDKITILQIKQRKMTDPEKLKNVTYELETLCATLALQINPCEKLQQLTHQLETVNELLWDIEDRIREKEFRKEFDDVFIALARSVYITNDRRAAIKRQINELLGSMIIEEKMYLDYGAPHDQLIS